MNTSLKGALSQSKKSYTVMEHNGKRICRQITLKEYETMLKHFISKGYEGVNDIPDNEIDTYLNSINKSTFIANNLTIF